MKNFNFLVLLLLLFPILTAAQEGETKFRVELSNQSIFTLGYVFEESPSSGFGYEITKKTYNYSIALSVFRQLGNRLELGLGLGYANRDAFTTCYCVYCDKWFIPNFYSRFRSIEIPVELRWKWRKGDKKIKPYTSITWNNRFSLNKEKRPDSDFFIGPQKSFVGGLNLGLGTQISLFEKWSLVIAAQVEKNQNFLLEENTTFRDSENINRWLDEWSIKFGFSRGF